MTVYRRILYCLKSDFDFIYLLKQQFLICSVKNTPITASVTRISYRRYLCFRVFPCCSYPDAGVEHCPSVFADSRWRQNAGREQSVSLFGCTISRRRSGCRPAGHKNNTTHRNNRQAATRWQESVGRGREDASV